MVDLGAGRRTNGYGGFSESLKGHFDSPDLGKVLLFVKSGASPTLWIERESQEDIYLSFKDGEKTKSLYQELKGVVPVSLIYSITNHNQVQRNGLCFRFRDSEEGNSEEF
ncbi:hypothetical protein DesyoDRAFT_1895 [Desulfosporosinus youngiae DSM 17734]|uniref:Uncharacterized protein n=1 Tax=Desulfosporosinus youngiae DSM 17734 TaxID=768710 RepID=H5XUJ0_9FIRM|nr:hypothetical protein DesyoDRAFT_1895 [Desulfosporosinus youngiae DSM 17734]